MKESSKRKSKTASRKQPRKGKQSKLTGMEPTQPTTSDYEDVKIEDVDSSSYEVKKDESSSSGELDLLNRDYERERTDVKDEKDASEVREKSEENKFDLEGGDTRDSITSAETLTQDDWICGICGPVTTKLYKGDTIDGEEKHSKKYKFSSGETTFCIECSLCSKWFHGRCVNIEEFENYYIDSYHCPLCVDENGASTYHSFLSPHRLNFTAAGQEHLPTEIGSRQWMADFRSREMLIPAPDDSYVTVCKDGSEFMDTFDRNSNWEKVFLIKDKEGLEMQMPEKGAFTPSDLVDIFGASHTVDTIDVYRQVTVPMTIGKFHELFSSTDRLRLFNFLSLEFSSNEKMKSIVRPPILVNYLSFVHKLWPEKDDAVNYEEALDSSPASSFAAIARDLAVADEHRKNKPEVALFCLCGMAGSYTNFHIDFGGSSVWYHIYKGQKVFYIAPPTPKNLQIYKQHQISDDHSVVDLGKLLPEGSLRRVVINEGETLMIPAGWLHAVYTPVDSLVFGGNFLHMLNVPMQLQIYDIEQDIKPLLAIDEKFFYPQFEMVNLYALRSFLLDDLKDANDAGRLIDPFLMEAAKAFLPAVKAWTARGRSRGDQMYTETVDFSPKLEKEIKRQEKLKEYETFTDTGRKGGKGKRKKRCRHSDDEADEDYSPNKSTKKRSSHKKKRRESDVTPLESPTTELLTPPLKINIGNFRDFTVPSLMSPSTSDDLDLSPSSDPKEKITLKITKESSRTYSSKIVDEQTPRDEIEQNMTKMFSARSSSGRARKPAAWVQDAFGNAIEEHAKVLDEIGVQPEVVNDLATAQDIARMNEIVAKEERDMKNEGKKTRPTPLKITKSEPVKAAVSATTPTNKKPKGGATTKQRLASKLGIRR